MDRIDWTVRKMDMTSTAYLQARKACNARLQVEMTILISLNNDSDKCCNHRHTRQVSHDCVWDRRPSACETVEHISTADLKGKKTRNAQNLVRKKKLAICVKLRI